MIEEWETKTMQALTDDERQNLVADLRNASDMNTTHGMRIAAADEIELLAGQLQTTLVMYGQKDKEIERLRKELELAQQPDGMFYGSAAN